MYVDVKVDHVETGKNITKLMTEQGFTVEKMADKLFLSDRTIEHWRAGTKLPSLDNLVALAEVLGVGTDDILARRVLH